MVGNAHPEWVDERPASLGERPVGWDPRAVVFASSDGDRLVASPRQVTRTAAVSLAPVRPRRAWFSVLAAVLAFLTVLGVGSPAMADPDDPDGAGDNSLIGKLEEAARAYYDTQAVLNASKQRQAEIKEKLARADAELARLTDEIGKVAAARYKGSSVGLVSAWLSREASARDLLAGAAVGEFLLWRDDTYIREYRRAKEESGQQSALLAAEVELQARQLEILDQQKRDAEKALIAAGALLSDGVPAISSGSVQPAPRNSAGGFSRESCSVPDPTTSRCVTPRTAHMLYEAQLNGYTRYVSCYRASSWGEHPLGRACDFSVTHGGFANAVASGDAKTYGDKLAAWGVANASALGIIYVIWYRQIWTPAAGWHRYTPTGDPATEHTNHVHISMY